MTDTKAAENTIVLPSDQEASGRTLGQEELDLLTEVIGAGKLFAPKGKFVKELETRFAGLLGVDHAYACTSGTAAIHAAIAAIDPAPGDEIITTPITDMGALTPILYQTAIPVFADVDPVTLNVTAETIGARISDRTKAIIVTHLFGSPCDMTGIMRARRLEGSPSSRTAPRRFSPNMAGARLAPSVPPAASACSRANTSPPGEGGLAVIARSRHCKEDLPLHQQGVGLRRSEPGPLLPGAELPDERNHRRGGGGPDGEALDGVPSARDEDRLRSGRRNASRVSRE